MSIIEKLEEKFARFPGIGPRQAKRFVQFLLTSPNAYIDELIELLGKLKQETGRCESCFRFFPKNSNPDQKLCSICSSAKRDRGLLMIVVKDADIDVIERSGVYDGLYFVLSGVLPVLTQNVEEKIKAKDLERIVKNRAMEGVLREVIFALPANPDGDNTAYYVNELISPLSQKYGFKISKLGRGLSTGLELEYSDGETIRNALSNRR